MKLLCPRCGAETEAQQNESFACGHCGGWLSCVPNGMAWMLIPANHTLPGEEEAMKLVRRSEEGGDPAARKKLLDQAIALCPDSLSVNKAVLLFGRLGDPCKDLTDHHRFKCYLLHVFEGDEKPAMQEAMLRELTEDPQLQRCLSLAPDRQAFIEDYCLSMCREYINLFIRGNSQYNGTIFGFRFGNLPKRCSVPVALMIYNMGQVSLPAPYDTVLPAAMRKAFESEIGEPGWLNEALERIRA